MKISIFTTITDPIIRGDNIASALACYRDFADEVIVVDGSKEKRMTADPKIKYVHYEWKDDFSFDFIGQQFTRGYEACSGDWIIHMDIDFIFHESTFGKIRQFLTQNDKSPAVSFLKWQFVIPDRYNLKSRLVLAVNKAQFGDRIKFDSGGDLCQPSLDGKQLKADEVPQSRIQFYNYEKIKKTVAQVTDDVHKMDLAYQRYFGEYLYSTDGSAESAFDGWIEMMSSRFKKPSSIIKLDEHPKYMIDCIRSLRHDQFGFDGFGLLERNSYVESFSRR